MAQHRLIPDAAKPSLVSGFTTVIVRTITLLRPTRLRQRMIRAPGARCVVIATIAPLVLAGAVGANAPRFPTSTTATRSAPTPSVAVKATPSGPAMVPVRRRPTGRHIAAGTSPGPSIELTNAVDTLGIPAIAMSAYRNAEQKMAASDPGCGISWAVLAGIGRIESRHANGGTTDGHGTAVRPIYGPALDGTLPGNDVIVQSNAGGRVSYARAVGPMQFLPGTWARYAADGDGDGVADPQNLYDSALAAARYLCSGGPNLRDQSQVMAAILRYNNSASYARNVLGWAAAYATGVAPVDLPPVTGPAPPLADPHLENPEGLGPGLPLNIHGLAPNDPLAQMPLIDFGPPAMPAQQPVLPSQPVVPDSPGCTVICIESQNSRPS